MDQEARASDRDREMTVLRLQRAYAYGRLASDEMESRVERALTAVPHGDLATLTADLPEGPGEVVTLTSAAGKIVRTGRWRVPRGCDRLPGGRKAPLVHALTRTPARHRAAGGSPGPARPDGAGHDGRGRNTAAARRSARGAQGRAGGAAA